VGEHSMLYRLKSAGFAGALALASLPAFALELPDSGSKNFSPGSDTPTHFTNEAAPVSARTADTTATDFSAEEAAAPIPSMGRPAAPRHRNTARHSKSGKTRGDNHSARSAKPHSGHGVRTASAYHSPAQARTTGRRSAPVEKSARVAGPKGMTPSAAKTANAKHGKSAARNAGPAVTNAQEA
jgi:hypothetical protein